MAGPDHLLLDVFRLSNAVQAAGISKPGSVSARRAIGRAPLSALTKRNGEYQKVSNSHHRLVCREQGWWNNMPVSDCCAVIRVVQLHCVCRSDWERAAWRRSSTPDAPAKWNPWRNSPGTCSFSPLAFLVKLAVAIRYEI